MAQAATILQRGNENVKGRGLNFCLWDRCRGQFL